MAEEKGLVKYQDRGGQEITLSFDIVRKFLVSGKRELVSDQEIMFFMGICKARGLNPFAKDAYLVKYTEGEGASIITSIDFFRARARGQKDCKGWQNGVIVQKPNGELRYSKGLVLEGEKLVGGWYSAQPEGWNNPLELEVNLNGYIKKTREGKTTKFWSEENQPTMIAKVAESQGLRKTWPNEFQGIYTSDEVEMQPDIIALERGKDFSSAGGEFFTPIPQEEIEEGQDVFAALVRSREANAGQVDKFVGHCAEVYKMSPEEIKAKASVNPDNFFGAFEKWIEKAKEPNKERKPRSDKGQPRNEPKDVPQQAQSASSEATQEAIPTEPEVQHPSPNAQQGIMVDQDSIEEMKLLCAKLNLKEEIISVMFTEDRQRREFSKMTNAEAGRCLGYLFDLQAKQEEAQPGEE